MVDEGVKVASAVRDRFDGKKRNPWNEFECGSNYARSMASYALIPILCGFEFDMPNKYIGFNPYVTDKFRSIWSVDGAWGEFVLDEDKVVISIKEGEILLSSLGLKFCKSISVLKIDGRMIDFNFENGIIHYRFTMQRTYLEKYGSLKFKYSVKHGSSEKSKYLFVNIPSVRTENEVGKYFGAPNDEFALFDYDE